jgi:3,4-dihydroxy-2-butanone 4-phosphate synthase
MADTIQEVLQAFANGELVVVTDDDDREGEGDLIVAASLCTAEKMAFIIRHTSGIVCAPITPEDARRLRLDPMVAHNESNTPPPSRSRSTTSRTAAPAFRPTSAPPVAGRSPTRMRGPAILPGPVISFR